jgi:hypothetical protein
MGGEASAPLVEPVDEIQHRYGPRACPSALGVPAAVFDSRSRVATLNRAFKMISNGVPKHLFDLLTVKVPEGLREHADCIKACEDVLNELKTSTDIDAVCVHEAGHFIFAIKFGVVVGFEQSQIQMQPPFVEHYVDLDGVDRFSPVPGSISTPFESAKTKWTLEKIWNAAQVAVAGGVFAGKIADRPDKGVAGDKELFKTYYRLAHRTLHSEPKFLEYSEYWTKASEFVREFLEEIPVMTQQAEQIAESYKVTHFGPYLAHCAASSARG